MRDSASRGTTAIVLTTILLGGTPLQADDFHVAPTGHDGDNGSANNPFATIAAAINVANAGDTIWLGSGTYAMPHTLLIRKSGLPGLPIRLWSLPDAEPILDFGWNSSPRTPGIRLEGDWWHLNGVTIQNATSQGLLMNGSDNILERVVTRMNGDSGIYLHSGAARNLIVNSDSYLNFDAPTNGEDADGFAAKFGVGPGNVFRGNRAWHNSDDGFDLWEAGASVEIEKSWAYRNGIDVWGVGAQFTGNGSGFKLGQGVGAHVLRRVLAWENGRRGIDVNENDTGVTILNSTVWNSGTNFLFDENNLGHILRNNLSFDGPVSIDLVDERFNSWNDPTLSISPADFLSLDPTIAEGPRLPGGHLPVSNFLQLAGASELIDAGTAVGLSYHGPAPDLGAYEVSNWACDFDGNASCEIDDLNALLSAGPIANAKPVITGRTDIFDLNRDGVLDLTDRNEWLAEAAALGNAYRFRPADANLDGVVDVSDLNYWNAGRFSATTDWDQGDFNGDGFVDVSDFNTWIENKFISSNASLTIPEPRTPTAIVALVLAWILTRSSPTQWQLRGCGSLSRAADPVF